MAASAPSIFKTNRDDVRAPILGRAVSTSRDRANDGARPNRRSSPIPGDGS